MPVSSLFARIALLSAIGAFFGALSSPAHALDFDFKRDCSRYLNEPGFKGAVERIQSHSYIYGTVQGVATLGSVVSFASIAASVATVGKAGFGGLGPRLAAVNRWSNKIMLPSTLLWVPSVVVDYALDIPADERLCAEVRAYNTLRRQAAADREGIATSSDFRKAISEAATPSAPVSTPVALSASGSAKE